MSFADSVIYKTRELRHPLCVGLDPHVDRIPKVFLQNGGKQVEKVDGIQKFFTEVIDRLEGRVVAVKPQSAFFEQHGWRGMQVLESLIEKCKNLNLPVILDAKRGDIGSTAKAYSRLVDPQRRSSANAITLNPYLGTETIEPYLPHLANGSGVFILVKTSNPGADEFQNLVQGERRVFHLVAEGLRRLLPDTFGNSDWSSLGVVVGATYPNDAVQIREILPKSIFLVPGYGAQGASPKDSLAGFVKGPHCLEGGVVNASRSILFPVDVDASSRAWEAGFESALQNSVDELREQAIK